MNEMTDRLGSPDQQHDREDARSSGTQIVRRSAGTLADPIDQAPSERSQIDVNELLRVLLKWKWLILGVVIAAIAASIAVTLLTTPIYRSSATLEINTQPPQVLSNQTEVQNQSRNEVTFLQTQIGLLSSRSLAERVMRTLNLADNESFIRGYSNRSDRENAATSKLMANLEVEPKRGSNLIVIGYSDADPARAASIINAFAQGFIDANLERRFNATSFARQFLQSRLAATRTRLEESERSLVGYARTQGIVSLSGQANGAAASGGGGTAPATDSLSAQSLVSFNTSLNAATNERIAAEQAYRQSLSTSRTSAQDSPAVQALRAQRAAVEADYQQKLTTFGADYPEMVALRSRMAAIDSSIANAAGTATTASVNTARAAYEAARGREQELLGQVSNYRSNVLDLRTRSIQYNILQRDVDTNRTLYDALLQRFKDIGVSGGIGESQASIVDNGIIPAGAFKPNAFINMAIGLLAGLVLGLGLAFGIEFVDDTIKSPEDVIRKLNVPALGLVPRAPRGSTLIEELKDQRSEVAEAYYAVMTSLQFVTDSGLPKTVLVTSSRASEGKSSTALALAQNIAKMGARTLLIDCDMRKPSFTSEGTDEIGVSALLTSNARPIDHVVPTNMANMFLMPSGPVPPNPAELLSGSRIAVILADLSSQFDVVVVDSPPVLGLADAPILSALCEATVMVVEAGKIRRPIVVSSVRRLITANAHVSGVVLTKFNPKSAGYGYGYGYGAGYGYGYGQGRSRRYGDHAAARQLDVGVPS